MPSAPVIATTAVLAADLKSVAFGVRSTFGSSRGCVRLEDCAEPVDRCGTQRDLERDSSYPGHESDRNHE